MRCKKQIEIRKAVVTGGAGFIGSHLVDLLVESGIETKVVDNLSTGRIENINSKVKFVKIDVRDFDMLVGELKGFDVVFHMAALPRIIPSIRDPITYHEINVSGTLNVLKASLDTGIKNVVYAASSSCYGNPSQIPTSEDARIDPLNPYAYQKYLGELYCEMFSKVYNLPTSCLRIFNPFGDRSYYPELQDAAYSSVLGIFIYRRMHSLPLQITGNGKQRRDFIYVGDVSKAFVLAGQIPMKGERINIGVGKPISVFELAEYIGGPVEYIPKRPGEADITCANIKIAQELLGWSPQTTPWGYVDKKIGDIRRDN